MSAADDIQDECQMYPKQYAGGETCLKSKRGVGGAQGGGGLGG